MATDQDTQRLHGVTIGPAQGQVDILLRTARIPIPSDHDPVWTSEQRGERYVSRHALYRLDDAWLLDIDCQGRGRFLISNDEILVDWRGGTDPDHYLQTFGLGIWLERHGVLCLHASCVERDGHAYGFLAPSQAGKSTLLGHLVSHGWRMLTDDMAALRGDGRAWSVHPSRAEIRLWPDVGHALRGPAFDTLQPVHERFAKRIVPLEGSHDRYDAVGLRTLFVLDRRREADDGAIEISPLAPTEAMVALLRHSMLADAVRALDIETGRLERLAAMVAAVPVMRVRYPSGLDRLGRLREVLEART